MSDAESKVRAAWEKVDARPTHTGHGFVVRLPVIWNQALTDGYFKSEEGAWSAALAFTEQRLREIAEVEEEIEILNSEIEEPDDNWKDPSQAVEAFLRILDREQAALAELKRGMKAEATQ